MPVAVPIAVKVYPINVGQGDAILLEVEYGDASLKRYKRYLIDGGPRHGEAKTLDEDVKVTPLNNLITALDKNKCISKAPESTSSAVITCEYRPYRQIRLDSIVITHPDADHHGGINVLLGSKEIKSVEKFTVFCPIITTSAASLFVTEDFVTEEVKRDNYRSYENAECYCPHFWFQKKAPGLVYTGLEDVPQPSHVEIGKENLKDCKKNLKDSEKNVEDCKKNLKDSEKNVEDSKKNLKDSEKNLKDSEKNVEDCKKKLENCKKCNETSILTTVKLSRSTYEYDVVLTGDSNDRIILDTLELRGTVGVFQVPHHGSRENSSYEFYMQFDADIYFISHGAHKTYNHPHKEVITGILSAAVEKEHYCTIVVTATWFEESKINYFMRKSTSDWRKFVKIYYFKKSSSHITLDCSKLGCLPKGLSEYTESEEKEQRQRIGIDNVMCRRRCCAKVTRCATNDLCAECLTCTVCDEFTNESDVFTAVCKICESRAHASAETNCTTENTYSYVCIKCRTCTICEKEIKKSQVIKCGGCKASAHVSCVLSTSTDASNYICCKCDPPLILAKQTRSISHTTLDSLKKTIRKRKRRKRREIIKVNGDGNCFFNAMAININNKPNEWQQLLAFIPDKQISSISKYLRLVLVKELLGERRQCYEDLVPSVENYEEEVNKFRAITFYNSPIGDLMPDALATALKCSIVIFFEDPKRKRLTIQPIEGAAIATAFLLYNPEGTGHYDAARPS